MYAKRWGVVVSGCQDRSLALAEIDLDRLSPTLELSIRKIAFV
jgi:hypothetical protein